MSDHSQHIDPRTLHINTRAEAAYDFLLALVIGASLAALLVAWWSS